MGKRYKTKSILSFALGAWLVSWPSQSTSASTGSNMIFSQMSNEADTIRQLTPVPQLEQRRSQDGRKFPRLWMGSIRWEQPIESDEDLYEIENSLNPVIHKVFNFQLIPQLRTPDNRTKALDEGYYVLRMVILRPEMDEDRNPNDRNGAQALYRRYVSGTERIVQLEDGAIKAKVDFRFNTISATSMKNSLLIQLLAVKPSSLKKNNRGLVLENSSYELAPHQTFLASVIRIPFVPRYASGLATPPTTVTASDMNEEEETLDLGLFMRQAEAIARIESKAFQSPQDPQKTAQALNLNFRRLNDPVLEQALSQLTNNNLPRYSLSQFANEIEKISQNQSVLSEDLAASFCRILIANATVDPRVLGPNSQQHSVIENMTRTKILYDCIKRPEDFFALTRQVHIRRLNNEKREVKYINGAPMSMSLNANFGFNRSHSQDLISSWTAGVNMLLSPIDVKGVFKFGYSYSANESNSRSQFEGKMTSSSIGLDIHQWDMRFKIEDYTNCLAVVPKQDSSTWHGVSAVRGQYLCQDNARNQPILATERYYYIFPSLSASPALNLLHPRNQPVNMLLRGQRDYYAFLQAIHRFVTPVHDQQRNVALELREATNVYKGSTPVIPTILSYSVRFEGPQIQQRVANIQQPTLLGRALRMQKEKLN